MRNLQFTMSNVDGYTIYMHIGCLNCPEFLLPPILSNVKPTSETPSLDNSTVLNTRSCVGACPQSQVGPLSARLCHRTRPSWNCRRFADTLDLYHYPNFALPFQNTFWISELLAVAKRYSRSASDKYTGIIEKPEVKTQAHSSVQLTAPCVPVSFQSLLPTNKKL